MEYLPQKPGIQVHLEASQYLSYLDMKGEYYTDPHYTVQNCATAWIM